MDKNRILVIDDEHSNIMALTHILRPEYTVFAAKNGREGIDAAVELSPDLILLDVVMPGMDGYMVLDEIKNDSRISDIPVIFITGLSGVDNEGKALSLGAVDYIVKPFVPDIVKLRVKNQIALIDHMRILLEKELEEKSHNAKIELLMNMSHDMLTPMNAIMGMAQIAKRAKSMDEIKDCLNDIDEASRELLELIKKMLSFDYEE